MSVDRVDDRRHRSAANEELNLVAALPGLARIAAAASIRLTAITVEAYLRTGARFIRGATSGAPAGEVLQQTADELRAYLRDLLALTDDGDGAHTASPHPPEHEDDGIVDAEVVEDERPTPAFLRDRGAELLRRSADLDLDDDEAHPAYSRILGELAPDEARILRLLVIEGPQPSVDVRTAGPLGKLKDDLVAPGLNMIGVEAGIRRPERIKRYLDNLYRLGLIWFSREELADQARYQVLEAQPEVTEAMGEARRSRTVRRSIHLTPFGEDFCKTCLPLDSVEIDALPREARTEGPKQRR